MFINFFLFSIALKSKSVNNSIRKGVFPDSNQRKALTTDAKTRLLAKTSYYRTVQVDSSQYMKVIFRFWFLRPHSGAGLILWGHILWAIGISGISGIIPSFPTIQLQTCVLIWTQYWFCLWTLRLMVHVWWHHPWHLLRSNVHHVTEQSWSHKGDIIWFCQYARKEKPPERLIDRLMALTAQGTMLRQVMIKGWWDIPLPASITRSCLGTMFYQLLPEVCFVFYNKSMFFLCFAFSLQG